MQIEKEETELAQKKRKEAINNANRIFFVGDERVQGLHSAMKYCDVIEGRKYQKEFKQQKKQLKDRIHNQFLEQEKENMKKFDNKEEEKRR